MIKIGTWKSEPANEEAWEVDWSIHEPDPEFLSREAWHTLFSNSPDRYLNCPWVDASEEAAAK